MTITAWGWRIHLDALLARLIYRWWWWSLPLTLLSCLWLSVGVGLIHPFWKTVVPVTLRVPPGATVTVDGRPWTAGQPLYAGARTLQATTADGATTMEVVLTTGLTQTLALPAPLPAPTVHPLPPPAPGYVRGVVRWADGAWRLPSHTAPLPVATPGPLQAPVVPAPLRAGPTLALTVDATTRLVDVDAYGGLADRVRSADQAVDVIYRPATGRGNLDSGGSLAAGTLEIRGWQAAPVLVSVTDTVTLVALAPAGDQVLLTTATPQGGVQLWCIAQRSGQLAPLVALPGSLTSWSWAPAGTVLVAQTTTDQAVVLTAIRLDDGLTSVLADVPLATVAGGQVPTAWGADGAFWWLAPQDGGQQLWQVDPATLLPTAQGPLAGLALTVRPDGALWVLQRTAAGTLQVVQWRPGQALAVIRTIPQPVSAAAWGLWQNDEVVVLDGPQGWVIRLVMPTGGAK